MPIYQYTCSKCGSTFDELLPASRADEAISCPSCGEKKTTRNITSFAAGSRPSVGPSSSGGDCAPRGRVG